MWKRRGLRLKEEMKSEMLMEEMRSEMLMEEMRSEDVDGRDEV